jgi:hypothetical protein
VIPAVVALIALSLSLGGSAPSKTQPSFLQPFPPGSVWNTALPAAPKVDLNSSGKIEYWLAHSVVNPSMSLRRYGWAIVQVKPGDPKYKVRCLIYACPFIKRKVSFPRGSRPDPSPDGHLAVYDPRRALEWDFWISHCPLKCGDAGSGNVLSTAKLNPHGGANASGLPGLAGIIHPEDLRKGHIDHPLVFAMPAVGRGFVCPAISGGGENSDSLALPEGTLLQLDPTLDVSALPIPRWQRVIATALQRYGMYLEDASGNLQLGSENPINRGDLWRTVGLLGDYASISPQFPWADMRVLSPPAPWCGSKTHK